MNFLVTTDCNGLVFAVGSTLECRATELPTRAHGRWLLIVFDVSMAQFQIYSKRRETITPQCGIISQKRALNAL
jgi:hypothetical protein